MYIRRPVAICAQCSHEACFAYVTNLSDDVSPVWVVATALALAGTLLNLALVHAVEPGVIPRNPHASPEELDQLGGQLQSEWGSRSTLGASRSMVLSQSSLSLGSSLNVSSVLLEPADGTQLQPTLPHYHSTHVSQQAAALLSHTQYTHAHTRGSLW